MDSNLIPPVSFKTGTSTYLFGIFSLYPFAILLGMIASIFTVAFFWKKEKYPWDVLLTLIIITIPSSILGARLFYIFERLIYEPSDPFPGSSWYAIWEGGLSIQGGVLLPTLLNLWYLSGKRKVIEIRKVFGIILPTVLIGQAIGRWGNFANHEVYGKPVSYAAVAWLGDAIAYNMAIDGQYRVPLFFYESMVNLLGYILIVWVVLSLNLTKPGTTGALYLIWYGLLRLIMEPFREESYVYYFVLSVISLIFGIFLAIYFEWTGIAKYEKIKVSKFSFSYKDLKVKYVTVNLNTRWINE